MDKTIRYAPIMIFNKKLLLVTIVLFLSFVANAQMPFVPLSFNSDSSEIAYEFCESISSKKYLFIGNKVDKDSSVFVFLTDNYGNVIKKRFLDSNKQIGISTAFVNNDNSFSLFGLSYPSKDTFTRLYFCRVDSNLNIIAQNEKVIINRQFSPYTFPLLFSVKKGDNVYSILKYGIKETDTSTTYYSKWIKQKINSDTVFTKAAADKLSPNGTIYAALKPNELFFSNGYIIKVDTNFEFVDSMLALQKNPGMPSTTNDTVLFNGINVDLLEINEDIILAGTKLFHLGPFRPSLGLMKYNMTTKRLVSINSFPFYPSLVDDYSFTTTFNTIGNHFNNIYYASTLHNSAYTVNKLAVAKHDTSGKCQWLRYIETGENIQTISLFGTSDSGLMLLAIINKYSPVSNTDMFIIKLNENGFPLSIINVSEQLRTGIVLYPNPATNTISFKGAATGSQVLLYNMLGQLLLQEKIVQDEEAISVSQLPTGTYSYTINDADGHKISSGKWIKQ
ncbi:MAG: T9SS type A sorting domain-containing protein [Phycisphaerales bacterium]|nr:T9SS type A sorting domain-containing protein [Phycisphaerales bacterium]